ncbi:hypothetical protein AB0B31_10985 [Catellatospora citrea]|uniref:hypothetical protein n=1 Tax=Catellatospora citrea TaxID=53366 RepID=UPI0033F24495
MRVIPLRGTDIDAINATAHEAYIHWVTTANHGCGTDRTQMRSGLASQPELRKQLIACGLYCETVPGTLLDRYRHPDHPGMICIPEPDIAALTEHVQLWTSAAAAAVEALQPHYPDLPVGEIDGGHVAAYAGLVRAAAEIPAVELPAVNAPEPVIWYRDGDWTQLVHYLHNTDPRPDTTTRIGFHPGRGLSISQHRAVGNPQWLTGPYSRSDVPPLVVRPLSFWTDHLHARFTASGQPVTVLDWPPDLIGIGRLAHAIAAHALGPRATETDPSYATEPVLRITLGPTPFIEYLPGLRRDLTPHEHREYGRRSAEGDAPAFEDIFCNEPDVLHRQLSRLYGWLATPAAEHTQPR